MFAPEQPIGRFDPNLRVVYSLGRGLGKPSLPEQDRLHPGSPLRWLARQQWLITWQ